MSAEELMKKSRSSSNGSAGLPLVPMVAAAEAEASAGGGRAGSPRRSRRLAVKRDELASTDSDTSSNGAEEARSAAGDSSSESEAVAHHRGDCAPDSSSDDGAPVEQQPEQPIGAAAPADPLSCSSSLGSSPQATLTTLPAPLAVPWSAMQQQAEVASPTPAAAAAGTHTCTSAATRAAGRQQEASVAIRSGQLVATQSVDGQVCLKSSPPQDGDSCGLWGLLPEEVSPPANLALSRDTTAEILLLRIELAARHHLRIASPHIALFTPLPRHAVDRNHPQAVHGHAAGHARVHLPLLPRQQARGEDRQAQAQAGATRPRPASQPQVSASFQASQCAAVCWTALQSDAGR